MSWPLQEDFKPGEPMVQVPMDWFNTVSKILNTLVTVGCTLERTASPSQETPWRLIVAAAAATGGVSLSNVTPLKDAVTAVVGNDTAAAHGTHVHPLAFDTTKPVADTGTGEVGTAATYPHRDHKHPLNVDATPPTADAGSGSAGSAATYPRRDHAHPLNVDATAPTAVAGASAAGSAGTYARRDHAHADKAPDFLADGSLTILLATSEGAASANGSTWGAGGATGLRLSVVVRTRYSEADATPAIVCYYRDLTFDTKGRLAAISTEGSYAVDVPGVLTVS